MIGWIKIMIWSNCGPLTILKLAQRLLYEELFWLWHLVCRFGSVEQRNPCLRFNLQTWKTYPNKILSHHTKASECFLRIFDGTTMWQVFPSTVRISGKPQKSPVGRKGYNWVVIEIKYSKYSSNSKKFELQFQLILFAIFDFLHTR